MSHTFQSFTPELRFHLSWYKGVAQYPTKLKWWSRIGCQSISVDQISGMEAKIWVFLCNLHETWQLVFYVCFGDHYLPKNIDELPINGATIVLCAGRGGGICKGMGFAWEMILEQYKAPFMNSPDILKHTHCQVLNEDVGNDRKEDNYDLI